jgi:hypothetical protein
MGDPTENKPPTRDCFTKSMSNRLSELVLENYRRLFPEANIPEANKLSNGAWEMITEELNAEFPGQNKTVLQVTQRWNNMKRTTKSKVQLQKK